MEDKPISLAYRFLRGMVRLCYPRIQVAGAENLPEGCCVAVGNHAQANGPIAAELYFPGKHYIWCASQMMTLREVPGYAFQDFWSQKPRWTQPLYQALSVLIAPLSVCLFNNAHTIPVYRDARLRVTFRRTMDLLDEGNRIVIFPEHGKPLNHILYEFQDRFIDVARYYHHRAGKALSFVPMYLSPELRVLTIGKPIAFRPEAPIAVERDRIREALVRAITRLAEELPPHTVVPYRNIPRREYPSSRPGR